MKKNIIYFVYEDLTMETSFAECLYYENAVDEQEFYKRMENFIWYFDMWKANNFTDLKLHDFSYVFKSLTAISVNDIKKIQQFVDYREDLGMHDEEAHYGWAIVYIRKMDRKGVFPFSIHIGYRPGVRSIVEDPKIKQMYLPLIMYLDVCYDQQRREKIFSGLSYVSRQLFYIINESFDSELIDRAKKIIEEYIKAKIK